MKQLVIFTDLDGTLLDADSYSFEPAIPALHLLKKKNIPLVVCSSKTRKEIEHYRKQLGNDHPFVSENGGGIVIPKGYFTLKVHGTAFNATEENGYEVIRLGAHYPDLRKTVGELRTEGFSLRGFGDMTVEEVRELTGISIEEAKMAKERDFDEPFLFEGKDEEVPRLLAAIEAKGFTHAQGRFFHLLGKTDKGKAVGLLSECYRREYGEIISVALGDSLNDLPMLEKADLPFIVRRPDGSYEPRIAIPNLVRAEGIGPEGWNMVILKLVSSFADS